MNGTIFGTEPFLFPSLSPAVLDAVRTAHGVLLAATLAAALPHARRYFLSERWGGYSQRGWQVELLQNPIALPFVLGAWLAASLGLAIGVAVIPSAVVAALLSYYFFILMRWRGILRGMGAPGFIAFWLSIAVLLLEGTRRLAPHLQGLALFVLQVDFAAIMLSAGMYKLAAGYRRGQGMELGLVNPEWGYWPAFWRRHRPGTLRFRVFNELAWATEVVAAILMLIPPTRFLGGGLILVSFVFIATQIRLGFLCEMVIVCCLLFAHPGSLMDAWLGLGPPASPVDSHVTAGVGSAVLEAGLWGYLALLPFARAGLVFNLHAGRPLPGLVQRALEAYTNLFGLIVWRVFSADITNFYVQIHEQRQNGDRRLLSKWGRSLRYLQVAESITVTSLFTTLRYYPSNNEIFARRLLRYARTVPHAGAALVFEYVAIRRGDAGFESGAVAEFTVDLRAGSVREETLDPKYDVRAPAESSPVREGARPGSYAPLNR